jgi:hypothetical protein
MTNETHIVLTLLTTLVWLVISIVFPLAFCPLTIVCFMIVGIIWSKDKMNFVKKALFVIGAILAAMFIVIHNGREQWYREQELNELKKQNRLKEQELRQRK